MMGTMVQLIDDVIANIDDETVIRNVGDKVVSAYERSAFVCYVDRI